jgi:hypothetical protein
LALLDPTIRGNLVVNHTLLIKHQTGKEPCVVKTGEKRVTKAAHIKFLRKFLEVALEETKAWRDEWTENAWTPQK